MRRFKSSPESGSSQSSESTGSDKILRAINLPVSKADSRRGRGPGYSTEVNRTQPLPCSTEIFGTIFL
jgi:hypothetical protein